MFSEIFASCHCIFFKLQLEFCYFKRKYKECKHVYCIICILFHLNLAKDHHSLNSLPSGIYKIFTKQKYCCKVSLYACKYLYDFNESKKINENFFEK